MEYLLVEKDKNGLLCHFKTVNVIPLDKIKQAREEIKKLSNANPSYWNSCDVVDREDVLEILDKLIESEGVND